MPERQTGAEIEITPEMIEAGGVALLNSAILSSPEADIDDAVVEIYFAMRETTEARRYRNRAPGSKEEAPN